MKLSIITINYNNAAGLEETILSLVDQLNSEVEFIVIDGGSTDGSKSVIQKYSENISFWVSEKDNGIYSAQNKGITNATGDYCLFLNSGDLLAGDNVIKKIILESGAEDILYGDIITSDHNKKTIRLKSPPRLDIHHFMVSTLWHPSAIIKRNLFHDHGSYNENLKVTGDFEFFIRVILKHGVKSRYIPFAFCVFNLSGISNSPEAQQLQEQERKHSWQLNFSDVMIRAFEEWTQLQRSREFMIYKFIKKVPYFGKSQ